MFGKTGTSNRKKQVVVQNNTHNSLLSPELLNLEQTARILGISVRHLRRMISSGKFIPPMHLGRSVRYSKRAIFNWIDTNSKRGNKA